jgi:hypothetical protein
VTWKILEERRPIVSRYDGPLGLKSDQSVPGWLLVRNIETGEVLLVSWHLRGKYIETTLTGKAG